MKLIEKMPGGGHGTSHEDAPSLKGTGSGGPHSKSHGTGWPNTQHGHVNVDQLNKKEAYPEQEHVKGDVPAAEAYRQHIDNIPQTHHKGAYPHK